MTVYLDTDEEAGGAVHIGHGRNGEHVPEGLAALAIVQDAHGRLRARLDRFLNDGNRLGVRVWALQKEAAQLRTADAHSNCTAC